MSAPRGYWSDSKTGVICFQEVEGVAEYIVYADLIADGKQKQLGIRRFYVLWGFPAAGTKDYRLTNRPSDAKLLWERLFKWL